MGRAAVDAMHELASATSQFAGLVAQASGQEAVPSCGGWTVRDLTAHLGAVHRWAAAIVLSGQQLRRPEPMVTEPVAQWYSGTADALLSALRAVDPAESVPNFSRTDETAAFWPRRQMHETIVHTVDRRQALGQDVDQWVVPAEIAADGVEEVVQAFFPRLTAGGRRPDVREPVRLVATDLDRSWVVGPADDETAAPVLLPVTSDADAVVSGTASDLYLALWHRVPADRLELDGAAGGALLAGPTTP